MGRHHLRVILFGAILTSAVTGCVGCGICAPASVDALSITLLDDVTGAPVPDATVVVTCHGSLVEVDTARAAYGSYSVREGDCAFSVSVSAPRYESQTATASGQSSTCGGHTGTIVLSLKRLPGATTDGGVPRDDGGACLDSTYEPNDSPETAWSLDAALAADSQRVTLEALAICSPTDVDYFTFYLGSISTISVQLTFDRFGGDLEFAFLDKSLALAFTPALTGTGVEFEWYFDPGRYYVRVAAGSDGMPNTYSLTVVVIP